MERSYYERLGVEPSASAAEIRGAFTRRAEQIRPDRSSDSDAVRGRAADEMAALDEAVSTLTDPARRNAYDAALGR